MKSTEEEALEAAEELLEKLEASQKRERELRKEKTRLERQCQELTSETAELAESLHLAAERLSSLEGMLAKLEQREERAIREAKSERQKRSAVEKEFVEKQRLIKQLKFERDLAVREAELLQASFDNSMFPEDVQDTKPATKDLRQFSLEDVLELLQEHFDLSHLKPLDTTERKKHLDSEQASLLRKDRKKRRDEEVKDLSGRSSKLKTKEKRKSEPSQTSEEILDTCSKENHEKQVKEEASTKEDLVAEAKRYAQAFRKNLSKEEDERVEEPPPPLPAKPMSLTPTLMLKKKSRLSRKTMPIEMMSTPPRGVKSKLSKSKKMNKVDSVWCVKVGDRQREEGNEAASLAESTTSISNESVLLEMRKQHDLPGTPTYS